MTGIPMKKQQKEFSR